MNWNFSITLWFLLARTSHSWWGVTCWLLLPLPDVDGLLAVSSRWYAGYELHGCNLLRLTLMMTSTTWNRNFFTDFSLSPQLSKNVDDCIKHIQLSVLLRLTTVSCTGQIINVASICYACSCERTLPHGVSLFFEVFAITLQIKWLYEF
jgi:hypothetical protein